MVNQYSNGQKILKTCIFCGADFEEAQIIGQRIDCPTEEEGGCGNSYRISMYSESSIKKEQE